LPLQLLAHTAGAGVVTATHTLGVVVVVVVGHGKQNDWGGGISGAAAAHVNVEADVKVPDATVHTLFMPHASAHAAGLHEVSVGPHVM